MGIASYQNSQTKRPSLVRRGQLIVLAVRALPKQEVPVTIDAPTMNEVVSSTINEVVETASDRYSDVTAAITRNPLQAVGIAAGAGFVLALLMRGKKPTPARAY